jgi:tetratricopeptide (TPR) repeat protein
MTSANDEETARTTDANGKADAKATSDEEDTDDLELLALTPTPLVLPIGQADPIPPPPASPASAGRKRPPPLPPRHAPPPLPPRTTQTRPAAPPPPPPPPRHSPFPEDVPAASTVAAPMAPAPSASRTSASMAAKAAPLPARLSPSPDVSRPPPRPSQTRPVVPPPAAPPVAAPLADTSATSRTISNAAAPAAPTAPSLSLPSLPLPAVAAPAPRPVEAEHFASNAAIADARKRVEHASSGDRAALARARIELGILLEVAGGDPVAALAEYRAAHGVSANLVAPIAAARRLTPLRPAAPAIALLEAEVHATTEPTARVTRQLELGMLLASSGAPAERTCQAYREVLASRPGHPGALRGLEAALTPGPRAPESPQQMESLAVHLETMAAVFRHDTRLSAFIEVERVQLLEKLGRQDSARAAFESALALDGLIGPVRDAYAAHLLLQGQIETLVKAWATEAGLETDSERAGRLLYFAGRLAAERLDQKPQAIELFERAAGSVRAAPSVRRAALRELFRLYEAVGDLDKVVSTGTKVLGFARDSERAHWHRRLVVICEALGRFADMAAHAHQVLTAEPDDEAMREKLDRALAALGQHQQRMTMLAEQASAASTQTAHIDLLLRAAHIAEHDMGRPDLALLSLRSAWALDPSHPYTTDAIVRLLTPGTPPSLTDPDDPSRVRARIDFYV